MKPVKGKTVLCRIDINQPVDRKTGKLKSTARIEACLPTLKELSDKGARLVLLAHQGSDIEYKNFYTTAPHAQVLTRLLGREVLFVDDVTGPASRTAIRKLKDGEILLLDNVRFCSEEQTLFEQKLQLTHEQQAHTQVVQLAPWRTFMFAMPLLRHIAISQVCAALSRFSLPIWDACLNVNMS